MSDLLNVSLGKQNPSPLAQSRGWRRKSCASASSMEMRCPATRRSMREQRSTAADASPFEEKRGSRSSGSLITSPKCPLRTHAHTNTHREKASAGRGRRGTRRVTHSCGAASIRSHSSSSVSTGNSRAPSSCGGGRGGGKWCRVSMHAILPIRQTAHQRPRRRSQGPCPSCPR